MRNLIAWMMLIIAPATLAVGWKGSGKGGAVTAGGGRAVSAGITILEQDGNAAVPHSGSQLRDKVKSLAPASISQKRSPLFFRGCV